MNRNQRVWMGVALCVGLFLILRNYWHPAADPLQARFVKAKHAEARRLAGSDTNPIPSKVWAFFRAAERNNINAATDIYDKLDESEYAPRTNRPAIERLWDDFKETVGIRGKLRSDLQGHALVTPMWETKEALNLFRTSDPKWIRHLGAGIVQQDLDYWNRLVNEWLGDWLGEGTATEEVCRFCETVYLKKDLSHFRGDASFVADQRLRAGFARMRASIARVYHWHSERTSVPSEKQWLRTKADFAFRQAVALCPSLSEASETYAGFLLEGGRKDDALAVLRLWSATSPDNPVAREAISLLQQAR